MAEIPIGNAIRLCRKRAGLTQDELAARAGITQVTLSRWETQRLTLPAFSVFVRIARELEVTPWALLKLACRMGGKPAAAGEAREESSL